VGALPYLTEVFAKTKGLNMIWILAVLLLVGSAQADVIRKHHTTSQFMGSWEGTSTDYYTADRHASESTVRWTAGMMKTLTHGKETPSAQITRLDRRLVWTLDPAKKTYTEMTFEQFRDMMKKGLAEKESAENEQPDTTAEDMYTWTVEDKSDPQSKAIGGWNCRNAHIVATGVNKKDSLDKVIITMDLWNSADVPGAQEIRDFDTRYLQALGLDELALNPEAMQAAMLYQGQFKALTEAAKKAPGEPVQSLIEIQRNQLQGPSVGQAVTEGARQELTGRLPFGKKKSEAKPEKPEYVLKTKFRVSTELTEASTAPVEAAKFEIPDGYKLKK
jgi:hypothetical protein